MEMRRGRIGVAARTHGAKPLSASDLGAFAQARLISLQVRVIAQRAAVGRADVDRVAAVIRQEQLFHLARRSGEHGRAGRRGDVERFVAPLSRAARVVEGIDQLAALHACHRNEPPLPCRHRGGNGGS